MSEAVKMFVVGFGIGAGIMFAAFSYWILRPPA